MAQEIVVKRFGRPRLTVELSEGSNTVGSVLEANDISSEGLTILVNSVRADLTTAVRCGDVVEMAPKSQGGSVRA